MSQVWNEGYFTDVGYTYGYYREVSPVFQRFCLLINGFATPLSESPVHCELGFGQGVSVNVHAASNPGDYVATDFNPSHASHARSLALGNGRNTRLYDDSFEQFLNRPDIPQLDSISLHGIWTWVSRENHKTITEFVRRYLKPGGVLYNSYNCFPGWTAAYPLRQLFALHDRFDGTIGDAKKRVEGALSFSEALFKAKPNYLMSVVGLEDRLKKIMGQDRNYLAHEYFNREWNCMYFSDVVDSLTPGKVDFACSANPLDLVSAINLTPAAQNFLAEISHPIMREQVRDYFINQQFRKDLFLRGAVKLHPAELRNRLMDSRYVLATVHEKVVFKLSGPAGEVQLQKKIYSPIIDSLTEANYAPKTMREIIRRTNLDFAQVFQALLVLVGMGTVQPCQSEADSEIVRASCEAFNLSVLKMGQSSSSIGVLASPITGGGFAVDRIGQLFLLASTTEADPVQFAWQILKSNNEVIAKDGKGIVGDEANLAELKNRHKTFSSSMPILKALNIAA